MGARGRPRLGRDVRRLERDAGGAAELRVSAAALLAGRRRGRAPTWPRAAGSADDALLSDALELADGQSLFGLDWVAAAAPQASAAEGGWALIGAQDAGLVEVLGEQGIDAQAYPDLGALGEAIAGGAPISLVVADCTSAAGDAEAGGDVGGGGEAGAGGYADDQDVAEAARASTARVLGLVQAWLADERFVASRLAVVTRGAVPVGSHEGVPDLAGALHCGAWCARRSPRIRGASC